jgi:general secretion pathway protein L
VEGQLVSELRLYPRRDSLNDGVGCAWALLDANGRVERSGASLDDVPSERQCRLILAAEMVLMLDIELPDLPARKLATMLPAAVEAATLEDAEQLHVVMAAQRDQGHSLVAVTRKAWLQRILGQLRARGIHPEQALPEYLLLPWTQGEWTLLLNEDGVVARFDEHNGAALDQGEPPAGLRLALAQGAAPKCIRLYQGTALKVPDVDRWRQALALPVELAGAWDWRDTPWQAASNLLTGDFAAARGRRDWRALTRPLAIGLALLAGIQVAGMALDWTLQTREQAGIRAEMRALAEKALPAHATVVDPAWQVSEQLRGLRANAGSGGTESALALIGRLGQVWPVGGGPVPLSVKYSGKELELVFAALDAPWLEQLVAAGTARGLAVSTSKGEANTSVVRVRSATGSTEEGSQRK